MRCATVCRRGQDTAYAMQVGVEEDRAVTDEQLANISSGLDEQPQQKSTIGEDVVYKCFCFDLDFLEREKTTDETKIVLMAHNGDSFDFPVFLNSLKMYSLIERAKALDLLFLDTLKVFRSTTDHGKNTSLSLVNTYQRVFGKGFEAHNALCDCRALGEILSSNQFNFNVNNHLGFMRTVADIELSMKISESVRRRVLSLSNLSASKSMKKKISEAGIDLRQLQDVFTAYGPKGLIALLAMPLSKPRVTKSSKVLTKIVKFFEETKIKKN